MAFRGDHEAPRLLSNLAHATLVSSPHASTHTVPSTGNALLPSDTFSPFKIELKYHLFYKLPRISALIPDRIKQHFLTHAPLLPSLLSLKLLNLYLS